MKRSLQVLLIAAFLLGIAVPLYAQDTELSLESLAKKVDAMVELVTTFADRMNTFEQRLAVLEATATPTVTHTPTTTSTPTPTVSPTATATATPHSPTVQMTRAMNVRAGPGTNYPIVGRAAAGESFLVAGANPGRTWWQIIYQGQYAWVYAPLVDAYNADYVQVAASIPTPPPATATPTPQATPTPPPPSHPYSLVSNGSCVGNDQQTYFEGRVNDKNNNALNNVCLHIAFNGPRNTKCTGCGKPAGEWGFSPFGGPASSGTNVQIWIVNCPSGGWDAGRTNSKDFSNLSSLSPTWAMTISNSVACTGITFRQN